MSEKKTMDFLRNLAKDNNGQCLSKKYSDKNFKYKWQCDQGHTWEARYNNILKGSWCQKCKGISALEELKKVAIGRGGRLLSKKFYGSKEKHEWECENAHRWFAKASKVKNENSWCPHCKAHTIEQLQLEAEKFGGSCLSKEYVHSQKKLLWVCKNNHQFEKTASSVLQGTWCKECTKLNLKDLSEIATKRDGKLISKEYSNQFEKLEWECSSGHRFLQSPHSVKAFHWCPKCKENYGEKITRLIFEKSFDAKFDKTRPSWLKTKEGNSLELDGFNEGLKIAFEHQGKHHTNKNHYFNKNSKSKSNQINRDKIKRKLTNENGIILIEIPQLNPADELKVQIEKVHSIINKSNIKISNLNIHISEKEIFSSRFQIRLKEINSIVLKKKGTLISKYYLSGRHKLNVICINKHEFKISSEDLKSGRWCPECAPNKKLSLAEAKEIAIGNNGVCLSEEYYNNNTKMRWKCNVCENEWDAHIANIKNGRWCPKCGRERSNQKRRYSLQEIKAEGKKLGFQLISKEYNGYRKKLKWKCKHGQIFDKSILKLREFAGCLKCRAS
ncbi:zinc-ribbon domain-containing protein [Leptospira stimsonii]|uniref:Treble clef zinc finger domain-containing protein n=1 Tax=Leptospira stimsonii TaxID=2202203 RepID=A0ABY2N9V2_9LEPT|nr:zinc-ribbon domain-containing protein [Leptospira stimsonii]TGK19023.1 hypothetical protein EHO98_12045 [Leptospira stimsonii]TGM18952.1 hypothetical protein EHQ90_05340 [Leptospira stimsonii]